MDQQNIMFVGAGAIGTSMGNSLAKNPFLDITLLSIEEEVVLSINESHINQKYFPTLPLNPRMKATMDIELLRDADIILLGIPSVQTVKYIREHKKYLKDSTIIVNLAKGFGEHNKTITECLEDTVPNPVFTLKGPTFARDIMNNQPTAFTLAGRDESVFELFRDICRGTNIYLDFTTDIRGVEILSILKNIYAIVVGIADAHFDSPNLRFLVLTKAFKEMRKILLHFGGEQETIFRYCGYGDFSLTALNDLSRNRTLGLLIGKGFFSSDISDKVILEGKIAVNVFTEEISKTMDIENYPIIQELYKVFNDTYDISAFVSRILATED